jgi:UDP-3-O-[3-hydroxymyristoyl] glucosamine N-acyltransferase
VDSFSLRELAALTGAEVRGDAERRLAGVATLETAGPRELSFVTNPRYRLAAVNSAAGALLVGAGFELAGRDLLVASAPYHALAQILAAFHPAPGMKPGIDPLASVAPSARVDPTAHVGALAVIGDGAVIGRRAAIHPLAAVGPDCSLGADSVVHSHAVLYRGTIVGERCIVHSGAVLGADGFGFATHAGGHTKVPQVGIVVIEDDVEIGANSAIDRAMLEETRVGAGSKIDDLVMVAHNVRIGRGSLLAAQAGIAGSSELGDGVVLAGQAGVAGHLKLGPGVRVAAKSAVFKDVPAGRQVAGIPAQEAMAWRRQQAAAGKLDELRKRVGELERRLRALEGVKLSAGGATTGEEEK